MIRKQARQRRDYLYRRAVLLKDAEVSEKRAKLREALASGKPIDAEIGKDKRLREDFDYDVTAKDSAEDVDDEYSELSGVVDPRVLVTTSRDPSSRLQSFSKEIRLMFPTGIRLNRGNLVLPELVRSCQAERLSDVVLLHEHRGTPTAVTIRYVSFPMPPSHHMLTKPQPPPPRPNPLLFPAQRRPPRRPPPIPRRHSIRSLPSPNLRRFHHKNRNPSKNDPSAPISSARRYQHKGSRLPRNHLRQPGRLHRGQTPRLRSNGLPERGTL